MIYLAMGLELILIQLRSLQYNQNSVAMLMIQKHQQQHGLNLVEASMIQSQP